MINSFYSFVTPVKNSENCIYKDILKLVKKNSGKYVHKKMGNYHY